MPTTLLQPPEAAPLALKALGAAPPGFGPLPAEPVRRSPWGTPGQRFAVLRRQGGGLDAAMPRWGLLPAWMPHASARRKPTCARAGSLLSRKAFREAFRRRRCLVPATGWAAGGQGRRAAVPDGVALLAGVWERWTPPDPAKPPIDTFALVLAPRGAGLPAAIPPARAPEWLAPDGPPDGLIALLRDARPCARALAA